MTPTLPQPKQAIAIPIPRAIDPLRIFALIIAFIASSIYQSNAQGLVTPSQLSPFVAKQGFPSSVRQFNVVISGVNQFQATTITFPPGYAVAATNGGKEGSAFQVIGNGTGIMFVRFLGSTTLGTKNETGTISGSQVGTHTFPLTSIVEPNPSFVPEVLFFSAIAGRPSIVKQFSVIIGNLSPTTKTTITAPPNCSLLTSPTSVPVKSLVLPGNATFILFARFDGSSLIGDTRLGFDLTNPELPKTTYIAVAKTLPFPLVTAGVTNMSGFTAVQNGAPSAVQALPIKVTGLLNEGDANVKVTAPAGFAVSLSGTPGTFVNSFILIPKNGVVDTKIFVIMSSQNPVGAVKGNLVIGGFQVNNFNVPLNGTITAKPSPVLTLDKTALSGFTTLVNKASTTQSYKITASNLDAGFAATVKAPTGYELSLSSANTAVFSSQLTIANISGNINSTIFVRLKSQTVAGSVTGIIQNTVAGISKNVSVSGTVSLQPVFNLNLATITGFNTVKNEASLTKTYTFIASNLPAGTTGSITAPLNYELRILGAGSFVSALTLGQTATGAINRTIEVRLKSTAPTGTVTGTIQNTVAGISKTVSLTGSVSTPTISTSTGTITMNAILNQASVASSYKLAVVNIPVGVNAIVSASSAYELALAATGPFSSTLTITQTTTHNISKDIFVRLKPSAVGANIAGSIQHSVAGLSRTIALNTFVASPVINVNPATLTGFLALPLVPSPVKTYSITASNLATGITASITAPTGYELAVSGSTIFSTSLTLTQTSAGLISKVIQVRLKAQAVNANVSGNITHIVSGISKTLAVGGSVKASANIQFRALDDAKMRNPLKPINAMFIRAFPNPATDNVTIEMSASENNPVEMELMDMRGNIMFRRALAPTFDGQRQQLSLFGLSKGMYMVRILSGGSTSAIRIVKQ